MKQQSTGMDRHHRNVRTAAKLLLDYMLEHREVLQTALLSDMKSDGIMPAQLGTVVERVDVAGVTVAEKD